MHGRNDQTRILSKKKNIEALHQTKIILLVMWLQVCGLGVLFAIKWTFRLIIEVLLQLRLLPHMLIDTHCVSPHRNTSRAPQHTDQPQQPDPTEQHSSSLALCHDVTLDIMTHRWFRVKIHSTPVPEKRGAVGSLQ